MLRFAARLVLASTALIYTATRQTRAHPRESRGRKASGLRAKGHDSGVANDQHTDRRHCNQWRGKTDSRRRSTSSRAVSLAFNTNSGCRYLSGHR